MRKTGVSQYLDVPENLADHLITRSIVLPLLRDRELKRDGGAYSRLPAIYPNPSVDQQTHKTTIFPQKV